ncbi:hypothetical protein SDC9_89070 [bioreactor metagenome]|uniref:Uncharacterized protein n=1 Tax=bioreactor metagenome TaxID=1076179 RepID=A0A644ZNC4_9ZZZZ
MKTLIRYSTGSISQGRMLNTLYMDKVELALACICVNALFNSTMVLYLRKITAQVEVLSE